RCAGIGDRCSGVVRDLQPEGALLAEADSTGSSGSCQSSSSRARMVRATGRAAGVAVSSGSSRRGASSRHPIIRPGWNAVPNRGCGVAGARTRERNMPVLEILVVLGLVLLNGYFAMAELAVISARPARLEARAREGRRGARLALALAREPGRMLSTVQIGITLIGIVAGVFGGTRLAGPLAEALARVPALAPFSAEIAYTVVVVAITYLSLIIGELVPKQLALRAPERIATVVAPAIDFLARISTPAVWLLDRSSKLVLRLLGVAAQPRETVTEEEVRTLIAEGTRAGVFHREEQEMIGRVLRLADRPVRAIITPRVELVWLNVEDDPAN